MNKIILIGRITKDPAVSSYMKGDKEETVARTSIAVDRPGDREKADFFNLAAFGKTAEWMEKYARKGTKLMVSGPVRQDTFTNREGQTVRSIQVIVEEHEFCESKKTQAANTDQTDAGGWMDVPEGADEGLPFN